MPSHSAAVEDLDDVGVLQAGGGRRLAAEALDELVVLGEAAVEELERDLAAELLSSAQYTSAMPPDAEPADDPVAAVDERVARELRHLLPQRLEDAAGDRRGVDAARAALEALQRDGDGDVAARSP